MTAHDVTQKLNSAAMTYKSVLIIVTAITGWLIYLSTAINDNLLMLREVVITSQQSALMTIDLEYDKKIKDDSDVKLIKLPFISSTCRMSYSQTEKYQEKCSCLLFDQDCKK